MDHEHVAQLIDPYVDGELDVMNTRAVEEHLRTCDACRTAEQRIRALREALTSEAPAFRAPARLRRNIQDAIKREERASRRGLPSWLSIATAGACAALLFGLLWFQNGRTSRDAMADEVVANHVRSLLATHLVDVPSSDQHTVKPWFNGKVDFAPEVRDFTGEGFPLVGGRLDYLNGRNAIALVYRHDKHPINLFLTPTARTDSTPSAHSRRGYHLVHWSAAGIDYWAVSDLNAEELNRFAALVAR